MKQISMVILLFLFCSTSYSEPPVDSAESINSTQKSDTNSLTLQTPNKPRLLFCKALYKQADMFHQSKNNEEIEEDEKSPNAKGPTKSFLSFFENIFSAITLGFYQPDNQPAPKGVMRVIDPVKKLAWDAPKSILYDTPTSLVHSFTGNQKDPQPNIPEIAQNTNTTESVHNYSYN